MWIAFREHGVDLALAYLDPDVEFQAHDGRCWTATRVSASSSLSSTAARSSRPRPRPSSLRQGGGRGGPPPDPNPRNQPVGVHLLFAPREGRADHADRSVAGPRLRHHRPDGLMRRVFPFVCVAVAVDTMFFAAITPLLPTYQDNLGLSKTSAGLLTPPIPPAHCWPPCPPAGWPGGSARRPPRSPGWR